MKVFYSWQSDLPKRTNWSFIEDALQKAAKSVAKDNLGVEPVIDRDTQNISGSPDIAQTIFDKIRSADAFVCDASIINSPRREGYRLTPNPNVLVELGYAAATLTWDRIIVVNNSAFGREEDLPFDVRGRRVISYQLSETATEEERKIIKQQLVGILSKRIRDIRMEVLKRAGEVDRRNIDLGWLVDNMEKDTIELLELPDLTDFSYSIAPFSQEELSYLRENAPEDEKKALAYNLEAEKALADSDLRHQWIEWNSSVRRERASRCGIAFKVLYTEARDILVTLEFPEQVEIFDLYKKITNGRAPILPKLPKLSTDRRRADVGQTMVVLPSSPQILSPRSRSIQINSNHQASIHIERLAQRRVLKLDGQESFLIAACGPPGEYRVRWQADAPTLHKPIDGELGLVIKPDRDAALRRLGANRYIGPPLEFEIVHQPNDGDVLEQKEVSTVVVRESQWMTVATRQKQMRNLIEKWLRSQHTALSAGQSINQDSPLNLAYLATNSDGSHIGIWLCFLTLMETARSELLNSIKRLEGMTSQCITSGTYKEVTLVLVVPDHASAHRIHRIIGEAMDHGTIELHNIRPLIVDLIKDELDIKSFS